MVTVLFAMRDSIYKSIPGLDVYDAERDALTWPGGTPVIAHPPCRLWSRMRKFSTAPASEKGLALFAVEQVRQFGGVLEHPQSSQLWSVADLTGGILITLDQWWFGHLAEKRTTLFIVGVSAADLPPIPFRLGEPEFVIASSRRNPHKKRVCSKRARSATPQAFAAWLHEVAKRVAA